MGEDGRDEQQQQQQQQDSGTGDLQAEQTNPPPGPIVIAPAGTFELRHLGFDRYAAARPGGGGPGSPPIFPLKLDVHPTFVEQYGFRRDAVLSIALTGRDRPLSYVVKPGPGQAAVIEQHPTAGSQPWAMQSKDIGGGRRGHWLNVDIRYPYDGMRIQVEVHPDIEHHLRRGCDHVLVWRGGQIQAERA